MTDDMPAYGTPPEPKYGRHAEPQVDAATGEWVQTTPEQIQRLRKAVRDADPNLPEPRRDPFGIVLASILLAFSFGLAALAVQGGWWSLAWVLYGPFAMFGGVGMVTSVRKVPRDEKGNPIS